MSRSSIFNTTDDEPIEQPPGFRFHPTDEELITHYLSPKLLNDSFTTKVIAEVDLNKVEPWDLPWKARMGEKEWYFFYLRDRKYPTGSRTNRATEAGYWKATGKDKEIFRGKILVGMKKTLVFYRGRAPRGERTNWVMHEYRLEGKHFMHNLPKSAKNEWVICRIFKKTSGGKKVHISGLTRSRDFRSADLPPLMDFSSDENQTSITTIVCGPTENPQEVSSDYPNQNPNFLSKDVLCTGNMHGLDSDQSIQQPILEVGNTCMKQKAKVEFSQEFGVNFDISYGISNQAVGFKPFEEEDQDIPIISTSDFDCLWNY